MEDKIWVEGIYAQSKAGQDPSIASDVIRKQNVGYQKKEEQ